MAGVFEVKKAKNGEYHFNLKSSNGQVILSSQMYSTRESALRAVSSVQANAASEDRYVRKEAKKGFHFVLKATNGWVIGSSEIYNTEAAMEKGVASVKSNGPRAKIVELG